jgi:hypothetical protein
MRTFKQAAHELIDRLPDEAGWLDLIDRAAERQDMIEDADLGDYGSRTEEATLQEYDRFLGMQGRESEDRIPY